MGHRAAMKTTIPRSPADRDRAVARLRAITIGSTLAGFAAVGGFGAMAAASYHGTPTDVTTAALTGSTATGGSAATTTDPSSTTATTATTATTGSAATGTSSARATAAPTATTGTAHVSTGSS